MAIKPIKVSQLNSYIKRVLQSDPLLGNVTVIGEISNLKYHGTGHVYFTLKDDSSKLSCFLPSEVVDNLRYELTDGMEINAAGYIFLYERGGSYSLNVREIIIEGTGNLSIAFEKLKNKLSSEGLFDEKYKKPLPFFPKKIAVVTSETGAAVKDILKIIKTRNNIVDVLIYPCIVQGPSAAGEISRALETLNDRFPDLDLLIVGRGGGSMEELWAFNEEIVARSIFASKIPVISAVGHEIDVTISDLVADKRAETPTAAAQMAVPHIAELSAYVKTLKNQLLASLNKTVQYGEMRLQRNNLYALGMALDSRIKLHALHAKNLKNSLDEAITIKFTAYETILNKHKSTLETLNPLSIMAKGYAAIIDHDGKLITSAQRVNTKQNITVKFKDGNLNCEVKEITINN